MSEFERRDQVFGSGLELREQEGGVQVLHGVFVPWNTLSTPLWRDYRSGKLVRERFIRGAFTEVLASEHFDAFAYRDHDRRNLVGRSSSRTLRIRESGRGGEFEIDLPGTTEGKDLAMLVDRQDIRGSSFEFAVDPLEEGAQEMIEEGDYLVREIRKVKLLHAVNPTATPAYKETEVALEGRSEELAIRAVKDLLGRPVTASAAALRRRRLDLAQLET